MDLVKHFTHFLRTHCSHKNKMLLGLSGGPDSMALFHLLLIKGYPFEVAHIDHGWREESHMEATYLEELCKKSAIPFHGLKLPFDPSKKNIEDRAREARLDFFQNILKQRRLEGLFLAHHADDQAETVLKRVFEGAHLSKIKGLTSNTQLRGMRVYRPFLKIRKREIIEWLNQREIFYFLDETNKDPRFLRSRMRETIIPQLSSHFGKEIVSTLCRLGDFSRELGEFLELHTLPMRECIQKNEWGQFLDFKLFQQHAPFLWKLVIKDFFQEAEVAIPYPMIETIYRLLVKGSANKFLYIKGLKVHIDKKILTLKTQTTDYK